LLLCVPPKRLQEVEGVLKKNRTACAAMIGKIIRSNRPRICMID
jgi:hydrogenase maturation factor